MKRLIHFILTPIVCIFGSSIFVVLHGQTDQKILTNFQKQLIFEKANDLPDDAQIAIAIIKDGEVKFSGIKRVKDSTTYADNAHRVFETGSISKVFTSTLLSNYVVGKKVKLDDNINDFIGFSINKDVKMTFEQLSTHTSGLPRIPPILATADLANPYVNFGENELIHYLSEELEMINTPSEKSEYSNLGGGFLGYVLGEIEDKSYEEMAQELIFSKYKMENSTTDRDKVKESLVIGLSDDGKEVPNWDMSILMGAGGVLSSVHDLSKFALAQFDRDNKELELTRKVFFKINETFAMGLGWSVIKDESGVELNWHNGGTGGYTSSMILDVKGKDGIIILSNISALGKLTNNIGSLSYGLMQNLMEEENTSEK